MKEESGIERGRFFRSGHFDPELRERLIKEIISGVPRSVIVYHYGVSRAAISKWMRRYGSAACKSRQSGTHLSDAKKRSLQEKAELAVDNSFEMKDKPGPQPAIQDSESEALKKALEEAQLKISALNTLIDVAEDQFKIKIRKKAGARQSKS